MRPTAEDCGVSLHTNNARDLVLLSSSAPCVATQQGVCSGICVAGRERRGLLWAPRLTAAAIIVCAPDTHRLGRAQVARVGVHRITRSSLLCMHLPSFKTSVPLDSICL